MKFTSDTRIKAISYGFGHSLGKKQKLISSPCAEQYFVKNSEMISESYVCIPY